MSITIRSTFFSGSPVSRSRIFASAGTPVGQTIQIGSISRGVSSIKTPFDLYQSVS